MLGTVFVAACGGGSSDNKTPDSSVLLQKNGVPKPTTKPTPTKGGGG